MIVTSTKHVSLPNETYCGIWSEYVLTIPWVDGNDKDIDLEIPTDKGTPSIARVNVTVLNNVATFEAI